MSALQPSFYNSSVFQSYFLQGVKFGVNFFTDPQVLNRELYNASSFKLIFFLEKSSPLGRFSFRKSSFCVVLHHWDAKVDFFALSWKSWFRDEQLGQKTYFDAKFVTRININHFSILINFWNETSVACQSVNQSFHYPSDFESHLSQSRKFWREIVFRGPKIVGNFAFKKIFFWSFHPVKRQTLHFLAFLRIEKKYSEE